jgi:hypothetical protein
LDINLQPQRSSSNKLDLEWIQEYIKCKIKLSLILVLNLNAVQISEPCKLSPEYFNVKFE